MKPGTQKVKFLEEGDYTLVAMRRTVIGTSVATLCLLAFFAASTTKVHAGESPLSASSHKLPPTYEFKSIRGDSTWMTQLNTLGNQGWQYVFTDQNAIILQKQRGQTNEPRYQYVSAPLVGTSLVVASMNLQGIAGYQYAFTFDNQVVMQKLRD